MSLIKCVVIAILGMFQIILTLCIPMLWQSGESGTKAFSIGVVLVDILLIVAVFFKITNAIKDKKDEKRMEKNSAERYRLNSIQNTRFAEIEPAIKQTLCTLFSINGPRLEVELNAIFSGNDQLKYGSYFGGYQKEDWFIKKDKLDTVIDLLAERFQRKQGPIEFGNVWCCPCCGSINYEKDSQCCVCLNNRNESNNVLS